MTAAIDSTATRTLAVIRMNSWWNKRMRMPHANRIEVSRKYGLHAPDGAGSPAVPDKPIGQCRAALYPLRTGITATILNTTTGQPIQKFTFGRMPKPWVSFNLTSGELVTADRVEVGKPAPGSFAVPVTVWVTPKK